MQVKALCLLSGGLDSILAAKLVADQGVDVTCVHFMSPFFSAGHWGKEAELADYYFNTFGLKTVVRDVSEEFMPILLNPRHGYGKNFNPCIDCKIFLFGKALAMMKETGASFLITGEVVGQRPMSQRRDTMNLIANQFGAKDILLRPLCAKLLEPTLPEREGWVDREKLLGFNGRSRAPQIALAKEMGIGEYPTPAGGCSLTDPILSLKIRRYFDKIPQSGQNVHSLRLLLRGRTFLFPTGSVFTMGRDEAENFKILDSWREGDMLMRVVDAPSPLALYHPAKDADERELCASILLRYSPKAKEDAEVMLSARPNEDTARIKAPRADEETVRKYYTITEIG